MEIRNILNENRIILSLKSNDKAGIIREIAELFLKDSVVSEDKFEDLVKDLLEREELSSTGMQEGIAIPHTKSATVDKMAMAIAIDKNGKDFSSMDGKKTTMFFMLIAPETTKREHLDVLAIISKLSFEDEMIEKLLSTQDKNEVIEILSNL